MPLKADIIAISAPASASPGESVRVETHVKNISTGWIYALVTGIIEYDTIQVPFESGWGYWGPGDVMPFITVFNMPASNVRFHVGSWYWDGAQWIQDDYAYVDIASTVAPPPTAEFSEFKISNFSKV